METRLYVGNLHQETTEQDLWAIFSEAGTVGLVEVVMDPKSGRSRGFAFVTMSSEDDAQKAVQLLNVKEVNGRIIKVNITLPRGERPAANASVSPDKP